MDLNLLTEFVTLARHLNFSRTAQELNLTQPTLSRHIVQLEEELGVQMFRRDRQSVSLTEAGALFLPEAAAVLTRYEAARRRLQEYRDGIAGSLILGCRWIYHGELWPGVLHRFRQEYPQVGVRLISYQQADSLREAVRDGVVDAAVTLRAQGVLESDLQGVDLYPVPLVAAMRESHPLAGRPVVNPAELAKERLVVPQTRSGEGIPALMRGLFGSFGLSPAIHYSGAGQEEALLQVQLDGVIALVPQCYYPEIPLPGLRAPQVAGTAGLFQMTALARADSPNAAVALFLRLCRAQVKQARLTAGAAVE